ncbi:MAG: prepilin-type N-terminal cleavage/methylation domain-containing protein [Sulfurimonas sp.]|nr:prepilin-type N-terminal cleavage/methylation domain-containing protein [Sulfurimonas sp.]
MKRAGFTMIELIFVIVILGILAAVAVPKLTATRTDASVSKLGANVSTMVSDLGAYWTANGSWGSTWADMTNVSIMNATTGTTSAGADAPTGDTVYVVTSGGTAADACFSVAVTSDGNVSVTSLTNGTDAVCTGAISVATTNNVAAAAGTAKVHSFGGTGVTY